MSDGLTRRSDCTEAPADQPGPSAFRHRLLPAASGLVRPTCSCGAEAVKNGRTPGGAQAWRCPAMRLTQAHREAHAAAQARYRSTEKGAEQVERDTYARLKRRLALRIERKQARIAELEAEVKGAGDPRD